MMKLVTCFVLLASLTVSAADLQLEIGNFDREIDDGLSLTTRPFVGTFRFQDVPQPLEPVTVEYEFEVVWDDRWPVEEDWNLKVRFHRGRIRLLSDSIIAWPGPHKYGDVLRGTIKFVPMASGLLSVNVHRQPENWRTISTNYIAAGLTFSFGLAPDGSTLYVGPQASRATHFSVPEVFFSQEDSLCMAGYPDPGPLFSDEIAVTPVFKFGDTSAIRLKLTALKPIRSEMDVRLATDGLKLFKIPEPFDGSPDAGDVTELELLATPLPGADWIVVLLQFVPGSGEVDNTADFRQTVRYGFVLDEEGELRYARSRRLAESKLLDDSKLNTRVIGNAKSNVVIYGNGEEPLWTKRARIHQHQN